jgi:hypothetical protein
VSVAFCSLRNGVQVIVRTSSVLIALHENNQADTSPSTRLPSPDAGKFVDSKRPSIHRRRAIFNGLCKALGVQTSRQTDAVKAG